MRPTAMPALLVLLATAVAGPLTAQEPGGLIRVFLDCQTFYCDFDHFRREITMVDWVRDRQDAQVHVLGTAQGTGGGGSEYTFAFLGLREFTGKDDTLRYVSRNTDTDAEVRDAHVRSLTLGLVRYVATTDLGRRLSITLPDRPGDQRQATADGDPWNLWVFTIGVGGSVDGEQQEHNQSFDGNLEANRTSEELKIALEVFTDFDRRRQNLADEDEPEDWRVFTSHSVNAEESVVWSVGNHWSLGVRSLQSRSTFFNDDFTIRGGPAIEYSVFPYAESTHRELTLRYGVEAAAFNYRDTTIFGETAEVLPAHRLDINLEVQQPWGSAETRLEATQFLHDAGRHRVNLSTELDLRIVRGLSLSLEASVSRIKDQIYLAARDLSPEEILVRQRQQGTDYFYEASIGFEFQFGSKLANVVNPRMWF